MRVGDLRHRIQLLVPGTPSQSATGNDTTPKVAGKTVWAQVKPLSGRDAVALKTVFPAGSHKITMRYEVAKSLTVRWQIKWKDSILTIDQVNNVDGRNRWIEVLCTMVTP